jgi:hypothetical protein
MVEQVDIDASEVTQADIDAAKEFQKLAIQWTHDALTGKVELATDGTAKDYKHPVFQCFKRHRIAAEARGMAEIERLREALNKIVDLDHHNMGSPSTSSIIARAVLKGNQ